MNEKNHKNDQVIFKQKIAIVDRFTLELPPGSKILSFQFQYEQPVIWFICDRKNTTWETVNPKTETRAFRVFGTGHQIVSYDEKEEFVYIGTAQQAGGTLVWHLFEEIKKELEN